MEKITGNESYYPEIVTEETYSKVSSDCYGDTYSYGGVTLKQQMAKDFMAVMIKKEKWNPNGLMFNDDLRKYAKRAILATEILIEELNKHNENSKNPPGE